MRGSEVRESGGIQAVTEAWASPPMAQLVKARLEIPEIPARSEPFPGWIGAGTRRALDAMGIERLWAHQAQACSLVEQGSNVVVATPTASGKSLCYQIPIVEALARDPGSTAMLLFPTKALGRDQWKALGDMLSSAGIEAQVAAYDGDAAADARRLARSRSRVILTNPDMLHLGILPHHTSWAPFLAGLRLVVVDELHHYRGVFGSHFANVARRLERVLAFHGARASWIASSATIANPAELATALVGRPFELIDASGAPTGHRTVFLMTPPLLDPQSGVRGSYLHLAARAAADLVRAGLQSLVFAQSRRAVEILLRYIRDGLRRSGTPPEAVQGYRGGYLPEMRRRIEDGLKRGELRCVIATNALELGVDIGGLDAVVLAGWPGSVASAWQRIGRAGRRSAPSLAVLVGSASPLDQWVIHHPEWLAGASPERGLVNPDNLEIVLDHMRCAAFELPFEPGESFGALAPDEVCEVMGHMAAEGLVHESAGRHVWISGDYPGASVSLRSIGSEPYVIVDAALGETIGEMDARGALRALHPQAVYQHAGLAYLVESLDTDKHRALVREAEPDHYTEPMVSSTTVTLETIDTSRLGLVEVHLEEIRITERVTGFKKVRFGTHENLGYGEVDLPETSMETFSVRIEPTAAGIDHLTGNLHDEGQHLPAVWLAEGLAGLGNLIRHTASLMLMCDPHDLLSTLAVGDLDGGDSVQSLHVSEAHPGGVGLAEKLHGRIVEASLDALDALDRCPCGSGCPSCVGPSEGADPVRKLAARTILSMLASHVH